MTLSRSSRARDFAPQLRAAQTEVNEAARTPERLARLMEEAGIWRIAVPEAYGGLGASLLTWMRVVTELGRGDAGVAWGVTLPGGRIISQPVSAWRTMAIDAVAAEWPAVFAIGR